MMDTWEKTEYAELGMNIARLGDLIEKTLPDLDFPSVPKVHRFYCTLQNILSALHTLSVDGKGIAESASKYDFSPTCKANGYRSILAVVHEAVKLTGDSIDGFLKDRNKTLFRSDARYQMIDGCHANVMRTLTRLVALANLLLQSDSTTLFLDEDDVEDRERYLMEVAKMTREGFYGTHLGFYYSSDIQSVLRMIAVAMAGYGCGYEKHKFGSSIRRGTASLLSGASYYMKPFAMADKLVEIMQSENIDFTKAFWNLPDTTVVKHLGKIMAPLVQVNVDINIPISDDELVKKTNQSLVIEGFGEPESSETSTDSFVDVGMDSIFTSPLGESAAAVIDAVTTDGESPLVCGTSTPQTSRKVDNASPQGSENAGTSNTAKKEVGGDNAFGTGETFDKITDGSTEPSGEPGLLGNVFGDAASVETTLENAVSAVGETIVATAGAVANASCSAVTDALQLVETVVVTEDKTKPMEEMTHKEQENQFGKELKKAFENVKEHRDRLPSKVPEVPPLEEWIMEQNEEFHSVKVRLLCYKKRNGQIYTSKGATSTTGTPMAKGLIVHYHGGGFVAQSPQSHEVYLRRWAKVLEVPIISVDYSLAPENKFPQALQECFYVYRWALANHDRLGTTADSVVIAGDSAGGNLTVAVTLRCIMEGERLPTGILASYPALNLTFVPSPSRLLSVIDPLLPQGILKSCLKAYTGIEAEKQHSKDPLLSPAYVSNNILQQMPPTHIVAAGFDPLLDDSVLFASRLKALDREVTLKVFNSLPHGFLSLPGKGMVKVANDYCIDILKSMLSAPPDLDDSV